MSSSGSKTRRDTALRTSAKANAGRTATKGAVTKDEPVLDDEERSQEEPPRTVRPKEERVPKEERSKDDRRKQILKAAARVFAEKGYHDCRISDVAEAAGVAYGLVYHYYGNKDGLLSALFDTNWALFMKAIDEIAAADVDPREKLRQIVDFAFQAYELAPFVVKVLVLEFGRNARIGEALDNPGVARVFAVVARIFDEAKAGGELRAGVDPLAASVLFLGALETSLVSFVLAARDDQKAQRGKKKLSIEAMKQTFTTFLRAGAFVQRSSSADAGA